MRRSIETLPFSSLYSSKLPSLEKQWLCANQKLSLKAALNLLFISNILASILLFLFSLAVFSDMLLSLAILLISFASFLLLGFRLPKFLADKYAREVEDDLHLALRAFSLYLSIKWPYEKIIPQIANSNYSCSPLFAKASQALASGKSVQQSLVYASGFCSSTSFARSMQTLCSIYEKGFGENSLDYLAQELVQKGVSEVRAQSSKSAIFGLAFVAAASLFPAFFLILNVAAGPFLGFSTSAYTIWLFYIILLPALIFAVLFAMLTLTPSLSAAVRQKQLDLQVSSMCKNKPAAFLMRPYYESKILSDIKSSEEELAPMLLAGASSKNFSVEQMLEAGAKSPSKPFSKECSQILHQIKAGANPQSALLKWGEQTPSLLLSRSISLILVGYSTGASLHKALEAAAADLLSSFNLVRERASLLALQNYTLILASTFLVPSILFVSLSFSTQISELSPSSGLIESAVSYNPQELISAAQGAIPIYLILNCTLAAFFISTTTGARHKFLSYAAGLCMLSEIVWFALPIFGS
ncbi:MAG: type II secretion system F family protein [Candidatus Micrarchaeota archaeon]